MDGGHVIDQDRIARRRSSRLIDRVTDILGHEATFVVVVIFDVVVLTMIALVGVNDPTVLATTSVVVSLATLVMICAVQHTSSRESKALNLKLDELIRVSAGRNDLIGTEDESHRQLDMRRDHLQDHARR
jgi:low affinity Fe/Cu permease